MTLCCVVVFTSMSDNKASNPSSSCNSREEPVADINNEIRVELQRVLCGFLWDKVMSKGDSLYIADQEKVIEELYHGILFLILT
mmetsp:Transcript_25651/g.33486  ORF Transcript_25651/g.33486 Transcript_25651/m.33486 type:complete len:84 (+) Transcript_25651:65-316(+)